MQQILAGGLRPRRFPCEDCPLPRRSPMVTANSPRLANHPVARNQKCNGIPSNRTAHRSRRLCATNDGGNILIGNHRAHGNPQQGFPTL